MRLAVARHDVPKVGICCSGGGIRAASYALGCLRALDEHDVLRGPDHADHISAVSGGSYAVGAMALVQHSIEHAPRRETNHAVPAPFSDDSPELGRLRNHLSYLTHGPGGVVGEVWRMFLGVLMNVALLLAVAVAAGTVAGWVYGWSFPELRETCQGSSAGCSTAIHPTGWAVWGMATLGLTALTVGLLWVLRRWPRGWHRTWVAIVVATTIGAVGVGRAHPRHAAGAGVDAPSEHPAPAGHDLRCGHVDLGPEGRGGWLPGRDHRAVGDARPRGAVRSVERSPTRW